MQLAHLSPASVFRFFEMICAVPHGSGNTKALSDLCCAFAREHGLDYTQDNANNVVITAPAAPGYENAPTVILQGHLDMVCAKAPDCDKDMQTEGLDLFTEGNLIGARGTSLGGDDGIAVAMMLALLDDPTLPRPRIEAVFTADEEIGMLGATALDASGLRGRTMLNIDSEEEGVFTVSCAGGALATLRWSAAYKELSAQTLRLCVSGLCGGHSGTEINKGRANANILMGALLRALSGLSSLRLCALNGGTADNAIPRSCCATVALCPADMDAAMQIVQTQADIFRKEFASTEPELAVSAAFSGEEPCRALTAEASLNLIRALTLVPNGIQSMSRAIPGLPETSLNLGVLSLSDSGALMHFCVRSSVNSRKETLLDRLRCVAEATGAACEISGVYPAWEYSEFSPLRERMTAVYRAQYGCEPKIDAIHAGLECGILAEKLPGLDCVSFGPNIPDIHTERERLSVSSVQRTWALLLEVLRQSK